MGLATYSERPEGSWEMSLSQAEQQLLPDVTAAQAGDIQAFERLIHQCQRSVSSIALAIVRDLDASEDICQQVFIHLWQQLDTLQNPASFLPWVRQITRYRAFNYLRDHKVSQRLSPADTEQALASFISNDEPDGELLRAEQSAILATFISQLPEESREITLLYYREEQNSRQVAQLLGISEAKVRKQLQRVRQTLHKNWLQRYGQLVFSSAPGLGLSSLVTSALLATSPPASAAAASTLASQSSGLVKLSWLLSGAMLGALTGVIGVVLGMRSAINSTEQPDSRKRLLRLRSLAIAWVLFNGLLLTAAYSFTQGASGPLSSFTFFIGGLCWLQWCVWRILQPELVTKAVQSMAGKKRYQRQKLWSWAGLALGASAGYAGLIAGLIRSHRWFW